MESKGLDRKKILFVCGVPPLRKIANFESAISAPLLAALAARDSGVEIKVVCPRPNASDSLELEALIGKTITGIHYVDGEKSKSKQCFQTLVESVIKCWPPSAARTYVKYRKATSSEILRLQENWFPDILHIMGPTAATLAYDVRSHNAIYCAIDSLSLGIENGALGRAVGGVNCLRRYLMRKLEKDLVRNKNGIVYVSSRDAEYASRQFRLPTVCIPIGCDLERFQSRSKYNRDSPKLIFVGSPLYAPNREALHILIKDVLPAVKECIPRIRLHVIGRGSKDYLQDVFPVENKYIEQDEFVESLGDVLASALVAVYPLMSGSGMKNKVLDALSVGLPVAAYPEAISGHSELRGVSLAEKPGELAGVICRLVLDEEFWLRESADALASSKSMSWSVLASRYLQIWTGRTPIR